MNKWVNLYNFGVKFGALVWFTIDSMIDILLIMQAWPFSKIGQKISKHKKNNDQIMTFNLLNIEIIVSNFTFYIGRLIKGS